MPLRPLPYREVKRKLEAAGFAEISQKGSHVKFSRQSQTLYSLREKMPLHPATSVLGALPTLLLEAE